MGWRVAAHQGRCEYISKSLQIVAAEVNLPNKPDEKEEFEETQLVQPGCHMNLLIGQ